MQISRGKLRLGIIGTGIIALEGHVPALERLRDRFEVTALCNHTAPKAEALAERLGLAKERSIWLDWRRLLEEAPLDAVLVCLPIELNYQVSEAAARAGKHVLCEKPAGRSLEEVRAALDLSRKFGVTYMVAEDCHYTPVFLRAVGLLCEGAIGKVNAVVWSPLRYMPLSNKYARTAWRIEHSYPGGYLLDGGVHNVHVLQMLSGPVESVQAEMRSIEPRLGAVDHAFCLLNHSSGVLSSLNLSWHAHNRGEAPLQVFGSDGSLFVENDKIVRLDSEGKSEVIEVANEDAFYLEQLDFHRAVTTGATPSCTPESTSHDVVVVLALLEAAREKRAVRVARLSS